MAATHPLSHVQNHVRVHHVHPCQTRRTRLIGSYFQTVITMSSKDRVNPIWTRCNYLKSLNVSPCPTVSPTGRGNPDMVPPSRGRIGAVK